MSNPIPHTRLQQQLQCAMSAAGALGPSATVHADVVRALLASVSEDYQRHDAERQRLEYDLKVTSEELVQRNEKLRQELERRTGTQVRLERELAQRKRAESELHRSLFRLDQAQRIAELGYWQWDAASSKGYWSTQTAGMFGYEPSAEAPPVETILAMVHPEDRQQLASAFRARAAPNETSEHHVRVWLQDGSERTLRISGEVVRDPESGRITYVHGVCLDVSAAIESTRALLVAKERAEEMLLMKASLLENMSHEFRTPLTSILGNAECLRDEVGEDQQDLVSAILRGGQRLFGTLNAILDLAQLDGGSYQLALCPVDALAVAKEAARDVSFLAQTKGLELRIEAQGHHWLVADHSALLRVMANLIGNAVKFTQQGSVLVHIVEVDSHVSVRVADTGVGIHPDFLPHLFEEFRQESTGLARRHEGNGLGLAITRRIVDLMGGMISVESEPAIGSTFEVLLPRAEEPAAGSQRTHDPEHEYGSSELNALLSH